MRKRTKSIAIAVALLVAFATSALAMRWGAPSNVFSGAVTVIGTLSILNDSTIGSSNADTATINAQVAGGGIRFYNPVADLMDGSATVNWSQTTGTGWTFTLGTNNGRDGALEAFVLTPDATSGDVATFDYGSVFDLTNYDYIGMWIKNTSALPNTEFTITFTDASGTALTGCAATAWPAASLTSSVWMWVQYDISGCSDRSLFRKIKITGTASAAAEAVTIQDITVYKYSNGYGPALGELVRYPVSSGTVTQGEFAMWDANGTYPIKAGVRTAAVNAYSVAGIACTTSTTEVIVQTSGMVVRPAAGAIADNAVVQVQSGGVNIDDSGVAADGIGYATEAVTVTDEHTIIKLRP